jgi:hypothetical protein
VSEHANAASPEVSRGDPAETEPARAVTGPAGDDARPVESAGMAGPAHPADSVDSVDPVDPVDPVELLRVRAGLRPAPPPLEVDTFTLVLIGIGLWAVAFLALLPVRHEHRGWLEICVAGFGLGLVGLVLSRNRRIRRSRPR